ncbi:MAG: hypothetical protein GY932_13405 [Arcobacter sp.]|nr:hypothetical protein [Arcobacter sp.]
MELREQYKEKFGKYPSSQMKEETLLKKLGADIKEENITEANETKPEPVVTPNLMKIKERKVVNTEDKTVKRMTTRQRYNLLHKK